jgi:regulator of replication initiation timing
MMSKTSMSNSLSMNQRALLKDFATSLLTAYEENKALRRENTKLRIQLHHSKAKKAGAKRKSSNYVLTRSGRKVGIFPNESVKD